MGGTIRGSGYIADLSFLGVSGAVIMFVSIGDCELRRYFDSNWYSCAFFVCNLKEMSLCSICTPFIIPQSELMGQCFVVALGFQDIKCFVAVAKGIETSQLLGSEK